MDAESEGDHGPWPWETQGPSRSKSWELWAPLLKLLAFHLSEPRVLLSDSIFEVERVQCPVATSFLAHHYICPVPLSTRYKFYRDCTHTQTHTQVGWVPF